MKKDIKHIFWMLLCLFTIVACSDENHEMLITGPEIPDLDHEPYMFTSVSMTGCMFLRNGV